MRGQRTEWQSTSAQEHKCTRAAENREQERENRGLVARGSWLVAHFLQPPSTSHQSPIYPLFAICYLLFTIPYTLSPIPYLYAFYEPGISANALSRASGGSGGLSSKNAWLNPALAGLSEKVVEVHTNYRKFFLGMPYEKDIPGYIAPDISEKNVSLFVPVEGLSGGVSFSDVSLTNTYSQSVYALYLAKSLKDVIYTTDFEDIYLGLSLKYVSISYEPDEYTREFFAKYSSNKGALTGDFGVLYKRDSFGAGVSVKNFIPSNIGIYENVGIPAKILMGVSKKMSNFNIQLDALFDNSRRNYDIMPSIELHLFKVSWRAGLGLSKITTGFGISWGDLDMDFAFVYPYRMEGNFLDAVVGLSYRM